MTVWGESEVGGIPPLLVVEVQIARLDVHPGDVLLVKVDRNTVSISRLHEIFRRVLPNARVIFADKDIDVSVIRAEDAPKGFE